MTEDPRPETTSSPLADTPQPNVPRAPRNSGNSLVPSVAWKPLDVVWALVALFVAIAVGAILLGVAADTDDFFGGELLGIPLVTWAAVLQGVAGIAAAYGFSAVKYGASVRDLGLTHLGRPRDYGFALAAWGAAIGITIVYAVFVNALDIEFLKSPDTAKELLDETGGLLPALLLAGVWAPLNEELLFRGFIFPAFVGKYGVRAAVVISSAIFAAFHISPGAFVPTFVLGSAFALTYARSGSIVPGIVLHAAHNTGVILITHFGPETGA